MLISIDPGVKMAGVAAWSNQTLKGAWLVRGRGWRDTAFEVYKHLQCNFLDPVLAELEIAIERPQIYVQARLKGNPNDLVTLALMAGATCAILGRQTQVTEYLPREWKGQVPKETMTERIQSKLSVAEAKTIDLPAKSYQHNVWDAAGIGLHHLRRLK
jgi:hypothetical protein